MSPNLCKSFTSLQISNFMFSEFPFINSSVQILQVKLEILRNSSLIFRSRHQKYSIKKLFSNILWYSREKVFLTCLINSLYTFKKEFRTEVDFVYHLIPTFIILIFIELEPNIWVLVLGTLSKSCCDPLVSWLCSSLKGLKNCSKRSGRLLASLLKATDSCLELSLFRSIL